MDPGSGVPPRTEDPSRRVGDAVGVAPADADPPVPAGSLPGDWPGPARARQVFEASPAPMSLLDLATRRAHPNRALVRLLGYDAPDAPPFDPAHLTQGADDPATAEGLRRLVDGELDELSAEQRYVRADGAELIGLMRATVLRDPDGSPWAVLSVLHDVSGRHRAEQGRAESEARLRAVVDNLTDAVIVVDGTGVVTFASPSAATLVGVPRDSLRGTSAFEVVHPDDRDEVRRRFESNLGQAGPGPGFRFRLLRADGTSCYVEGVGSYLLDDPAVAGVVITLRDLTRREEVASALEVSESRFRKMLENISDTVTLATAEGRIIATTGNVREVMGYPRDFWNARSAFELVHPDDVALVQAMLDDLLATPGAEVRGEFRSRSADGEVLDIEGSAVNLLDDPAVEAIVVTTRNITPRKQAERELAAARDAAVRQLEIRNEFIASVSHELRTPIHGILGLSELLSTAELDDHPRDLARAIGRATESLRRVLDDLLDFAKIEAGRLQLVHEPVSLVELLHESAVLHRPQAAARGTALRVDAEGLPGLVRTDGFRLRQVLDNLVANAVKFTTGGEVVVWARPAPARDAEVDDRHRTVEVEVRDTGIGMAPDVLEHLFEPFSQAHASTAREFGGTGLGLTIAKRLVELLGGTVEVDSEQGRGSTFRLRLALDVVDDLPEAGGLGARPDADVRGSGRVLVVEDNTVNQLLIRHQLERLGYEPEVVGSGDEALQRFRASPPAAVLMDCQMPVMDGFATTERLRDIERDGGLARVPVVALTANALPGERARCLAAGMDDYLAKPVDLAALGQVLAHWTAVPDAAGHDVRRSRATGGAVPGGGPGAPPSGGPSVPEEPAVRSATLDELVEDLGDRDVVTRVVEAFRRELSPRVRSMADADGLGDHEALAAVAHTLAGASATVGADRLAAICRSIEVSPAGADRAVRAAAEVAALVDDALATWLDDQT